MCPKVSIVVPVYRVENKIVRCLESILNQSFSDFELILVDDGSPDNCPRICDEYAKRDNRIRVIHKENGGVSLARNVGIDIATGEYLAFVDSDDYVNENWLKALVDAVDKTHSDYILSGMDLVDEQDNVLSVERRIVNTWDISTDSQKYDYLVNNVLYKGNGFDIWATLYRLDIIQTHKIRFCLTCANFAEDLGFVLEYLLYCTSATAIPDCEYHYVQHSGSMMAHSEGIIKPNSVNEVSIQFGKRYFEVIKDKKIRKRFPILHYFLMLNQYTKINFSGDNAKQALCVGRQIENLQWHDRWLKALVFCKGDLEAVLGKRGAIISLLNSRLLAYRSWNRYCMESYFVWKYINHCC